MDGITTWGKVEQGLYSAVTQFNEWMHDFEGKLTQAQKLEYIDSKQAFDMYKALANNGCDDARYRYAMMWREGRGTPDGKRNILMAKSWLEKATEKERGFDKYYWALGYIKEIQTQIDYMQNILASPISRALLTTLLERIKQNANNDMVECTLNHADIRDILNWLEDFLTLCEADNQRDEVTALINHINTVEGRDDLISAYNSSNPQKPLTWVGDHPPLDSDCLNKIGQHLRSNDNKMLRATSKAYHDVVDSGEFEPMKDKNQRCTECFRHHNESESVSHQRKTTILLEAVPNDEGLAFDHWLSNIKVRKFNFDFFSEDFGDAHSRKARQLLGVACRSLSKNPNVQEVGYVELPGRFNEVMTAADIKELIKLTKLTSLNLNVMNFQSKTKQQNGFFVQEIAKHLTNLTSLDVARNELCDTEAGLISVYLTRLKSLSIFGNNLSPAGAHNIIMTLTNLTDLDMRHQNKNFEKAVLTPQEEAKVRGDRPNLKLTLYDGGW